MALTAGFKNLTRLIISSVADYRKDSTPYDMLDQLHMGSHVEFVLNPKGFDDLVGERAQIIHTERDDANRPVSRTAFLLDRDVKIEITYHNAIIVRPVRTPDASNIGIFNRRINALADVIEERKRQIMNYGEEQIMHPSELIVYLVSEIGEVADAYKRGQVANYREELVQVVALGLAGLESYDLDLMLYEQQEKDKANDTTTDGTS